MSDRETISFDITTEMASTLREAIESGDYQSPDDVLRDALQEWQLRRQRHDRTDKELRPLTNVGMVDGQSGNGEAAIDRISTEHDVWFRAEVDRTLKDISAGHVGFVSHEEHASRWERRRAEILGRSAAAE